MNNIFFSGCGLVTSLGNGVEQNIHRLFQLANSNKRAKLGKLDCTIEDEKISIPLHLMECDMDCDIEPSKQSSNYAVLDQVMGEAIESAGLSHSEVTQLGVFIGSTSFDINVTEEALSSSEVTDQSIVENIPSFTQIKDYIVQKLNIKGPAISFQTACTSSANALIYAAEYIKTGEIEQALVLGLEFSNKVTALGFSSLSLISSDGMRPFDKERDGLFLGEGCGAVILSKRVNRPNTRLFRFEAGAYLGDLYNITACNPNGATVAQVIEKAMLRANLSKNEISFVKAHATASLSNDEAESAGLNLVFNKMPPVTLFKPYVGHTLGACGIIELILFYQSILLKNELPKIPSNINPDKELGVNLLQESLFVGEGYFLLNYFGFGGNNAALIISNKG